jgi:hypothetical protein
VVAGKTGTAQATDRGHKDTIAWFACYAPFDHPRYVVAAMVQGGEHGGSVACPIADRIMERSLALEEGKFDMPVAWLAPAHKDNPFAMIKDVTYKDSTGHGEGADDENQDDSGASVQMADAGAQPDVEPEADAAGQVKRARAPRAQPVSAPERPRNFFEKLFGVKRQSAPAPAPTPTRRSRPTHM